MGVCAWENTHKLLASPYDIMILAYECDYLKRIAVLAIQSREIWPGDERNGTRREKTGVTEN
jgi:hypothetical protein